MENMKAKILIVLVIVAVITNSCSKDGANDKPGLSFKSVNATTIPQNAELTFMLDFTFKSVPLDSLFIVKVSRICPTSNPNLSNNVPSFSSVTNQKGTL